MRSATRVHEEWDSVLVESGHGPKVFYRVFYGTVNWDRSDGGMKPALMVVMQYGDTSGWAKAKAKDEIDFKMPAHILRDDLPRVLVAIDALASKHNFSLQ